MNMFAKILIKGELETVTGLHIGTGGAYSAIGAADSPVIRDVITGAPMIPGSSLKGKIRSLLARKYNDSVRNPEDDCSQIRDIFGAMKSPRPAYIFRYVHDGRKQKAACRNWYQHTY